MTATDLITVDSDILGGTPVFNGTRVPVRSLFEYLAANYTLDEFLECFPTVQREMALRVLERAEEAEDIKSLKILRRRALSYRPLTEYQASQSEH